MSNRQFLHTGLVDTSTVLKDTGDELILLQEQLANLVKETNQFTYIITHDLQAPLRMVTGFLELLERRYADKLDAGAKQYIEYSVKGANRMKSLIFDLLEYSRLSSVKHEFDVVDMREVLEEVIGKLSVDISSSGADVIIGALPGVWADRKMMV
ncbi:MAG TPA: histidine kinase dimerization/phospho-acceptor domain-containing protein, partial [Chitinophagaceae bacterium]|nr:histidine kinase dimerization/phospho-acceptor domain-containing protein [Chitinophagaceae bacterium]